MFAASRRASSLLNRCNPFRGRICCDVDPDKVPAHQPDDDDGVEQLASNQDQLARKARTDDAGHRDTAGGRAGHELENFSLSLANTEGGPRFSQTSTVDLHVRKLDVRLSVIPH
jgi:hypothetical protein